MYSTIKYELLTKILQRTKHNQSVTMSGLLRCSILFQITCSDMQFFSMLVKTTAIILNVPEVQSVSLTEVKCVLCTYFKIHFSLTDVVTLGSSTDSGRQV